MKTIKFITSNQGKIKTLNKSLNSLNANAVVEGINLDIIEPQADNVKEVSLIKAKKAFELLKQPVLVEDGGFEVETLNGFPGVYTKFMLTTIGVDGLLDLMKGKSNRKAKFVSCTTYIDENGKVHQFDRIGGEGLITQEKSKNKSDIAWSDIWYVFYEENLGKTFADCSEDEIMNYYSQPTQKSSLVIFSEWLASDFNKKV